MLKDLFGCRKRLRAIQVELDSLQSRLRVAEAVFQHTQPAMVTDAHARIQRVNEEFCALMGYRPEEMLGQTPRMFRSHHHDQAFYDQMVATIRTTGHWAGEVWDRRKSGEIFPKWMSIAAVPDATGNVTHMVACYTDLSGQQHAQQQIHQLAFYDVLTDLPNRVLLRERLQQAQTEAARHGHWGALLLLDWDDFKCLNDSMGHPQGDELLRHIATRLTDNLPPDATVARLGGDEYAIVLPQLGHEQTRAATQAETLAKRVQQALAVPYHVAGTDYQGSASQGLVLFAGCSPDADALLKQAELAMYQAKQAGRGLLHFFDETLELQLIDRMRMERALRTGIARGQLRLHYQPQIALQDGVFRVMGAEILVRWQHPVHGLMGPSLFIPLAEETGLIGALGQWVLRAACEQLGCWCRRPGLDGLTLAVNVSAVQFLQPDFAAQVLACLQECGAPPERLKLELTESLLVDNTEGVIATMTTLQEKGVRFSLDDFGTGYSSLQYLKRLPLCQLKIDQSFVRDLESDPNDAAIASAVAALARSLGLEVIAEGVETQAQQHMLASMGCHVYQGYWFSRPLPLEAFEAYCAASIARSASALSRSRMSG